MECSGNMLYNKGKCDQQKNLRMSGVNLDLSCLDNIKVDGHITITYYISISISISIKFNDHITYYYILNFKRARATHFLIIIKGKNFFWNHFPPHLFLMPWTALTEVHSKFHTYHKPGHGTRSPLHSYNKSNAGNWRAVGSDQHNCDWNMLLPACAAGVL